MDLHPTAAPDAGAARIAVRREETPATAADLDALIGRLDREPGVWMGCDVVSEGLYRKEAWAVVDPPLAFALTGDRMEVRPRDALGAALAALVPADGDPVSRLRRFLARLPADEALGLYGAWTFDHARMAGFGAPPAPDTRLFHLFLPDEVLRLEADGTVRRIRFAFDLPTAPFEPRPEPEAPPPAVKGDDFEPGGHAGLVARAVEKMRRGELISCVMSQSFRRPWTGDTAQAFRRLRANNPNPFMFFVNFGGGERLFGSSPDIQCRTTADRWVETAPVCGTFRRGADPIADHDQVRALVNATTDESSLGVCSDSDRNDKARVCLPGTVELVSRRRLLFLSTIVHTVDHLRGRLRPDADGFDILFAHTAPSTVVGTPKAAAVDAVAALEPSPRVWYAGAVARIATDGSCEAGTVLRYAWVRGGWAEVRTGGSLLATSDPEREEAESRLKTEALFRVLGFDPPAPPAEAPPSPIPVRLALDGDPFPDAVADALAAVGAAPGGEGVEVRTSGAPGPGPALLLGEAAADALGAVPMALPQNAARLPAEAAADGLLAPLGRFHAGVYATRRADSVPDGWRVLARAEDGRVLAAAHGGARRIAFLFRPDSVLSAAGRAGLRALRLALEELHEKRRPEDTSR